MGREEQSAVMEPGGETVILDPSSLDTVFDPSSLDTVFDPSSLDTLVFGDGKSSDQFLTMLILSL